MDITLKPYVTTARSPEGGFDGKGAKSITILARNPDKARRICRLARLRYEGPLVATIPTQPKK